METKVIVVTKVNKGVDRHAPRITLSGYWLNKIGFECGKLAVIQYGHGNISIKLHEADEYRELVRGALKDGSSLFQVGGRMYTAPKILPSIHLIGVRLETLGFAVGRYTLVEYEYGFIRLRLLDLERLLDHKPEE